MNWTTTWPTEPGDYLFYGCSKGNKPWKTRIVRVNLSGNGRLMFSCDEFLYPETHHGYWAPFEATLPKWELP